ncbi:MAG: fibronectin type III domain-containing protein [Anaerovoracaceae bacterium]|nr:fibronectin type III domain-containing protein [Anaerovoracaceae bacterium]
MKKFLTVLLVISVLFTFSFSSAFAATYTVADYVQALTAEKTNQMTYLENAKTQAVNSLKYEDGLYEGFSKAAWTAAADAVIADAEKAIDAAIRSLVEAVPEDGTSVAPYFDATKVTVGSVTLAALQTKDGMWEAMQGKKDAAAKVQAPLNKAAVEAEINAIDVTKYSTTVGDKMIGTEKVSNREYVEYQISVAKDAIKAGDKKESDFDKMDAYAAALSDLKEALKSVATIEDEAQADKENIKNLDTAMAAYRKYIGDAYGLFKLAEGNAVPDYFAPFVDKDAKTVFGVKVKDMAKVTKAEAIAINDAMYDVLKKSVEVVEVYADKPEDVTALIDYTDAPKFFKLMERTDSAAALYEDVVAAGEKLKKFYFLGEKVYDDAAVDAAVKAAKELVYDLSQPAKKDAEDYIFAAAAEEDIDLYIDNGEYQKFLDAIDAAQDKMIVNFEDSDEAPAKKISYGSNKTPEADFVYLQETYAYPAKWHAVAEKYCLKLETAQSYAEIDEILAEAAEAFGDLMLAKDKDDVEAAIAKYVPAVAKYADENVALNKNLKDYTKGQIDLAVAAGQDLIRDAITVDGVKAAYAEAKALVDSVKTDKELAAMKEALIKEINALPYLSQLTAADKDAVMAVVEKYNAYKDEFGAEDFVELYTLENAVEKVLGLADEALADELEAFFKKIDALDQSDAGLEAFIATKEEAEALTEKAQAFFDDLDAATAYLNADIDITFDIDDVLDLLWGGPSFRQEYTYWQAEVDNAARKIMDAAKDNGTVEEMKAALDAYKALNDKQTYYLNDVYGNVPGFGVQYIYALNSKLAKAVETLKITASSTAAKGSITVKWTVKGDAAAVEGYEIWKSTKHSSGYKKAFTTTKKSYKNTKGLKKGTRYYYKVRAIAYDMNGKKITSDWSNKARRIAK